MVKNEVKQKEIGRIPLGEGQDLVVNLVGDEKLDFRIWVNTERYKGPTKRGVRFYLWDGNWEEFRKLIKVVDKEVEKVA